MFGNRAVAALELALSSPLLILTLGGVAYLGLAQYDRAMLANAVAAGAQYAVLTGSGVSQANITSVIQDASGLPNAATSVTVSFASVSPGVPSAGWYCVTGSAPTVTSSTSGGTCTDGSSAGYYMSFKASYTVNGFMNGFREALSLTMSEQATVRLQ